jgi:hypothetical protein
LLWHAKATVDGTPREYEADAAGALR